MKVVLRSLVCCSFVAAGMFALVPELPALSQSLLEEGETFADPGATASPTPTPIAVEILELPYATPTTLPYSLSLSGIASGNAVVLAPATSLPLCSYWCNFQAQWEILNPPCDSTAQAQLPVPCPTPVVSTPTPTPLPPTPRPSPSGVPGSDPGTYPPPYGGGIGPGC